MYGCTTSTCVSLTFFKQFLDDREEETIHDQWRIIRNYPASFDPEIYAADGYMRPEAAEAAAKAARLALVAQEAAHGRKAAEERRRNRKPLALMDRYT